MMSAMEKYTPTLRVISPEPSRLRRLLESGGGIDITCMHPEEPYSTHTFEGLWADFSAGSFPLPHKDSYRVLIISYAASMTTQDKQQLISLGADLLVAHPVDEADAALAVKLVKRYADELVLPREIAETMGQGLTISDGEGNLLYTNGSYARMLGRNPDNMLGKHVSSFVAREYWPLIEQQIDLRRSGTSSSYEVNLVSRDDYPVPVLVTAAPMKNRNGSVAVITDVSKLKQTQGKLQERERELASLIDHIPGLFYRCLPDRDWTMLFITEGCKDITGYTTGQLLHNRDFSFGGLIHLEDREENWKAWQLAIRNRGLYEGEYRIKTKDNGYRWVWERGRGIFGPDGKLKFLEGFITDITRRKSIEEALRLSEQRYRSLVNTFHDGVLLTDHHGNILFANPQAEDLTAQSLLAGSSVYDLVPASETAALKDAITLVRKQGGVSNLEFQVQRKDGTIFPVEVNVSRLPESWEDEPRYLVVSRDITDRRIAQEEHRLLQRKLYESQRIESLERLAGGIAHDFNNMLGVIIGYTEQMLESVAPDELNYQYLTEVRTASYRSAELTRQLLALSGQQYVDMRRCSLNELLIQRNNWFISQVGEGVTLDITCGDGVPQIFADPKLLEQAVLHLLNNARDAAAEGNGRVAVTTSWNPGTVQLRVEDFGCGMENQQIARVFEPFYTTKPGSMHTGLGLPIVNGIVRQHGGFVEIASTPGAGTAITINLPAADKES